MRLDRIDSRVAAYQDWLRRHRGISEGTIDRYGRMIMRLVPGLGADPEAYDAALVRGVIIDEARRSSRPHVKTMTTALRGYPRVLAAAGFCGPSLDRAVPTIPQWRLSALPRYLPAADVERLIASCDLAKPRAIRDRAILLLRVRLGLRAGERLLFFVIAKPVDTAISGALGLASRYLIGAIDDAGLSLGVGPARAFSRTPCLSLPAQEIP